MNRRYEFRWYEAPMFTHGPLPDGIKASIPMQKTLQFRTLHEGCFHEDVYSEWMDVPTVKWELPQFAAGERQQENK
jgi:hypothetical protein